MSDARRRQRLKNARWQASTGVPDLYRDKLVAGAVVVTEATGDSLADDIVRLAGRKPGYVGISVVVGEHGSSKVSAGCWLGIALPRSALMKEILGKTMGL